MRLAFLGVILGCSLTLVRHSAGLLVGRVICGVAISVTIFNAVPYAAAFAGA